MAPFLTAVHQVDRATWWIGCCGWQSSNLVAGQFLDVTCVTRIYGRGSKVRNRCKLSVPSWGRRGDLGYHNSTRLTSNTMAKSGALEPRHSRTRGPTPVGLQCTSTSRYFVRDRGVHGPVLEHLHRAGYCCSHTTSYSHGQHPARMVPAVPERYTRCVLAGRCSRLHLAQTPKTCLAGAR